VIPAFNVQSIDGFLVRLVTGDALLRDWMPISLPPTYKIMRTVVLVAIYGGVFWLVWRAERREPLPRVTGALSARDLIELGLVLTLALISSPVSWTHYYLLLLLPWSFYFGGLLALPQDAITRVLMWSGLVLMSPPVLMPAFPPGWIAEVIARTIVSIWLFGGLLMLAALARGAWYLGRSPAPNSASDPANVTAT